MKSYWYEELEEEIQKIIRQTGIIGRVDEVVKELAKELHYDIVSEERKEEIVIVVDNVLRGAFFEVIHHAIGKELRGFDRDRTVTTRKCFRELTEMVKKEDERAVSK